MFREHDIHPFCGEMTPPLWSLVPAHLQDWIDRVIALAPNLLNRSNLPSRCRGLELRFRQLSLPAFPDKQMYESARCLRPGTPSRLKPESGDRTVIVAELQRETAANDNSRTAVLRDRRAFVGRLGRGHERRKARQGLGRCRHSQDLKEDHACGKGLRFDRQPQLQPRP